MQIIVKLKMQMLSKVMKMMKKMMKKMRKKVRPHQYQINQYRQQSDSSYDSFWRSTYFLLDSSSWIPQELSTHFFFIKKLLICNRVPSPDYKSRICSRFVASLYGANVATNQEFFHEEKVSWEFFGRIHSEESRKNGCINNSIQIQIILRSFCLAFIYEYFTAQDYSTQ